MHCSNVADGAVEAFHQTVADRIVCSPAGRAGREQHH
jgi:hypothetical protein